MVARRVGCIVEVEWYGNATSRLHWVDCVAAFGVFAKAVLTV